LLRLLVYTSIPVACHLKNYPQTNMHGVVALAMRRHLSSATIKALKFVIGAEPKQAEEPGRRPSARQVARNAPIPLYLSFAQRKQS
jgi:hypothetical protein